MPLIEGVGDEVTLVFTVVLILLIMIVAWLSTHTRDIPFFSVLVVELRQRRRLRNQSSEQTSQDANAAAVSGSEPAEGSPGNTGVLGDENTPPSAAAESGNIPTTSDRDSVQRETTPLENSDSHVDSENTDSSALDPEDETDLTESRLQETQDQHLSSSPGTAENSEARVNTDSETVPVLDSHLDEKTLRERRLEFFSRQGKTDSHSGAPSQTSHSETENDRDIIDADSRIPSPSDRDHVRDAGSSSSSSPQIPVTTDTSRAFVSPPQPSHPGSSEREIQLEAGNIRVKLKYLNDTQRLVQSSPGETIGNFKRAHFASEMAEDKLVRLIFNGQDLQNDTTLQAYNIQDNCTVHCLVTPLQPPPTADMSAGRNMDLDISVFMFPLFGLVLAAVWYFRFAYRQYFNTMSTLSLLGITFLFCVAFFSTWRAQRENHEHVD